MNRTAGSASRCCGTIRTRYQGRPLTWRPDMHDWFIYTGALGAKSDIGRLPAPPPWRVFDGEPVTRTPEESSPETHRAITYRPDPDAGGQVHAPPYLRRPLLVT